MEPGEHTWSSGSRYAGDFVNDKMTGRGELHYADDVMHEWVSPF